MKKILKMLLALGLAILLVSGVFLWFLAERFVPPVSVRHLEVTFPESGRIRLVPNIEIRNSLGLGIRCSKAVLRVRTEEAELLSAEWKLNEPIPANRTRELALPVELQLSKIKELRKQGSVAIDVSGELHFEVAFRRFRVPFEIRKDLLIPEERAFSLAVDGVQVTRISRESTHLTLHLALSSRSKAKISDVRASYLVLAEGKRIAQGELALPGLPPLGSGKAEIPLELRVSDWKQIKKEHADEPVEVRIQGQLAAEVEGRSLEVPFSVTKEVVFAERPFEIDLHKIRIREFKARSSTYQIVLEVSNNTPMKISNLKIDGTISLGEGIDIEVLNEGISLSPRQKTLVELELTTERLALVRLLRQMVRQRISGRGNFRFLARNEEGTVIASSRETECDMPVVEE